MQPYLFFSYHDLGQRYECPENRHKIAIKVQDRYQKNDILLTSTRYSPIERPLFL